MFRRLNRVERRALERQIKREQRKERRQERRQAAEQKRQKELKQYKNAQNINKSLQFSQTVLNTDIQDYAPYLYPMMTDLSKSDKIMPGMKNEYFEVSGNWDGNLSTLFKNVRFFKIPDIDRYSRYQMKIEDNPHSSKSAYDLFVEQWHKKSFLSNLKGLNIKNKTLSSLVSIMQSSYAWRVAAKKAYDSEQTKSNWQELYRIVSEANDNDPALLNNIQTMLENNEDLETIRDFVDNAIMNIIKE